ncbi:MAG: hypothetical protein ACK4N5_14110, partial [Myxococcales bacterium]
MKLLALTMLLATSATPGWETYSDPALGVELLRPVGWTVEALPNDALEVRPPAPLQGRVLLVPVAAPGVSPRAVVEELARRAGAELQQTRELPNAFGAKAQLGTASPGDVGRVALIVAAQSGHRVLAAIVSAPPGEFAA